MFDLNQLPLQSILSVMGIHHRRKGPGRVADIVGKIEKRMLCLVNRNLENFNSNKMIMVTALTLWRGMIVSLYLLL